MICIQQVILRTEEFSRSKFVAHDFDTSDVIPLCVSVQVEYAAKAVESSGYVCDIATL
jgi:hypothetical protein